MAEQEAIIKFIENEVVHIEGAIIRVNNEINLIREYHTRLIADVVTGKIDVRGAEFPVLEAATELESMEPDENGADLNVLDEEAIEEFADLSANEEGTT